LLDIKNALYPDGWFQMQFSVHTTDEVEKRRLIPVRTWTLAEMAAYGNRFVGPGDLKVSLNFAPAKGFPLDPQALLPLFSPERFIIKLTPINPTISALGSGFESLIDVDDPGTGNDLAARFSALGYETILSIGDVEENHIGSNCGMYVTKGRNHNKVA
jgi:23S rRNA (adenine2503-C2)-methyltransferase